MATESSNSYERNNDEVSWATGVVCFLILVLVILPVELWGRFLRIFKGKPKEKKVGE